MPWGDGRGPYGTGPYGWQRGRCAGSQPYWPAWRGVRTELTTAEERDQLDHQEQLLQRELDAIKQRKATLE